MFGIHLKATAAALILGTATLISTATIAGDVAGPGCTSDRVRANVTDVFRMTFEAGQPALVGIRGDRDTDLDLEIRDGNGNRVCVSNGPTDYESCRWTPRWTGQFQVRVRNLGDVYNNYRICTN